MATLIVITAALGCLALIGCVFALLVWRAERDLDRLHSNVQVLERMTAAAQHDERLRAEHSQQQERELVRRLTNALK